MAKVKLSLAAAALASLLIIRNDRKTGRPDDEPDELAPGKSVNVEIDKDFHIMASPTGEPNEKEHANEAVVTAEAEKKNDTAVVLVLSGPSGKIDSFVLKGGDKRMLTLYEGQTLGIEPGDDLT